MNKRFLPFLMFVAVFVSALALFSCNQSRDPMTAEMASSVSNLKFSEGSVSEVKFNLSNCKTNDKVEIKVSDSNLFSIESVNGIKVEGSRASYTYVIREGDSSIVIKLKNKYNPYVEGGKSANLSLVWNQEEIASESLEVSSSVGLTAKKSNVAVSVGEVVDVLFSIDGAVYGKKVSFSVKGSDFAKITAINGKAPNADSSVTLVATDKEIRVRMTGIALGNAELEATPDGCQGEKVYVAVCDDMIVAAESFPDEIDINKEADIKFSIDAIRTDAVVSFALADDSVGKIISVNGVAAESPSSASWTVKSADEDSIVVRVKGTAVGETKLVASYKGADVADAKVNVTYDYDVKYMVFDGSAKAWKEAVVKKDVPGGTAVPEVTGVGTFIYEAIKYEFVGWTKADLSSKAGTFDGTLIGSSERVTADMVLYASYRIADIQVGFKIFDSGASKWIDYQSVTVKSGNPIPQINSPQGISSSQGEEFNFIGWTKNNISNYRISNFNSVDPSILYGSRGVEFVTDSCVFYAVYSHMSSKVNYYAFDIDNRAWKLFTDRNVLTGQTLPQITSDVNIKNSLTFRRPADNVEFVFNGGWTTDVGITAVTDGDGMKDGFALFTGKISNNIRVYATYKRNLHPVTYLKFNGSGWTQHKKIDITSGFDFTSETESRVANPAIYVRSSDGVNFLFTGWTTTDFSAERIAENLKADAYVGTVTDPMTVYATYKPMIADIVYHDMNGDVMATDGSEVTGKLAANAPFKHKYNNSNAIPNPIRTGYDFKGWYYKSDFSGSAVSNLSGAKYDEFGDVINLYAKWEPHVYTISYTTNGGTLSGTTYAKTHTYDQMTMNIATESDIAKRGYTFKGWYKTSSFTGDEVTSIGGKEYTTNISLYAKWEVQTYDISYEVNKGTMPSSYALTHTYDKATTLPTPSRTGYTFNGWYTTSNFSGSGFTSLSATGYIANITLYAKWTANSYAITYNVNGGTMPSSYATKHTYDSETTLPNPTRTGYTFSGWFTASNFSGTKLTKLSATGYLSAITLYAKWTPITYTVTYNVNGGTMPSSYATKHTYGTATALPAPTKSNLTFAGWYTSSGFSGSGYTSLSATGWTSNVTLYARWTAKVTYSTSVGTVPSAVTVNEGVTLSSVPSVSATGYRFMGWFSGSTKASTSYKVTGHVTFTASWEKVVTSITISESTWVSSSLNETHQLTASAVPSDATHRTISWSSSDTSVATVDSTGKVTAKKAGAATIKAYVSGETPSNVCVVVVTDSSSALKTSTNTRTVVIGDKNYITDSNQKLAYFFTANGRFDIMGRLSTGNSWSSSTYSNAGWRWKINDTEVKLDSKGTVTSDGLMLVISPTIAMENSVPYVVIYQTLINVTASTKTGVKFGSGADVQISGNDSAPIYNQDYGKSMSSGGISFNLYTRSGYNGVTATSTTWAGAYDSFMNHMYDNSTANFSGGDSAMTYSWTGLTLSPGQSVMKSVRMTLTGDGSSAPQP